MTTEPRIKYRQITCNEVGIGSMHGVKHIYKLYIAAEHLLDACVFRQRGYSDTITLWVTGPYLHLHSTYKTGERKHMIHVSNIRRLYECEALHEWATTDED